MNPSFWSLFVILADSLYYERTYVSLYVFILDLRRNICIKLLCIVVTIYILTYYYDEDLLSGA